LELESCNHPSDPCSCDALILYKISAGGIITEESRFCGETSNDLIENLDPRFILAFFTDLQSQSATGGGFDVNYYPSDNQDSTTTQSTVSTTPSHIISTQCGDNFRLQGTQTGTISYKPNMQYQANERCIWIVRFRNAEGLLFNLETVGTDAEVNGRDALIITTFTRTDPPLQNNIFLREPTTRAINGSVAVITFYSDETSQGTGFVLNFEVTRYSRPNISTSSRDVIFSSAAGSIDHPNQGNYDDLELSMFLIGVPEFIVDSTLTNHVTWSLKGFPSGCRDYVIIYKFYFDGYSQFDLYCATSPRTTSHNDIMLYVFMSDGSENEMGFNLEWYMD